MEAIKKIFDALSVGRSIIYVRRQDTANALEDFMQSKGMECAVLHGGIPKEIGRKLYNDFRWPGTYKPKLTISSGLCNLALAFQ